LSPTPALGKAFDIGKQIVLVPTFRETEVDSYFSAFERIASALQWPAEVWPLRLQCKIHGKAQEAVAALPLEDSLKYDSVKAAILRAYELVPEAYRQKFRNHKIAPTQNYVEFAREKGVLFDKWSTTCRANDFNSLRELILLEEFKKCLPDRIVVYLSEQKVSSLSSAAVLADEYVLTHKVVFSSESVEEPRYRPASQNSLRELQSPRREDRECFYCHQPGHVIANCITRKRREQQSSSSGAQPKGIGLIKTDPCTNHGLGNRKPVDDCFKPFIFDGLVSLTGEPADQHLVRILRDTACSQSVILASALPFSGRSACGHGSVLRGIEMGYRPRPVHRVHIQTKLVTGFFPIAVCHALPIEGVTLLMGNDIAGGKVVPAREVVDLPCRTEIDLAPAPSGLFPTCVKTRAEAKKGYDGSLFDGVLKPVLLEEAGMEDGTGVSTVFPGESAAEPVRSASPEMRHYDRSAVPRHFRRTVTYLGRQVGQGQVRPVDAKVQAITECPVPPTRRALRRFLGMAGYCRSFCRNFSTVTHPLTNLLSPKVDFVWTPECQQAFESAKALLSNTPVLAAPDLTRPFRLEVDASAGGAGAVLLQEDAEGVDHPVCYFSRKFNKHQVRERVGRCSV
jgi:hypothetical protein